MSAKRRSNSARRSEGSVSTPAVAPPLPPRPPRPPAWVPAPGTGEGGAPSTGQGRAAAGKFAGLEEAVFPRIGEGIVFKSSFGNGRIACMPVSFTANPTQPHKPTQFASHFAFAQLHKNRLRLHIFDPMKIKLFKIFLLLTGFCYLMQTLEMDSKEVKQNYEKETHTYISCTKTTDTFNFTAPTADITNDFSYTHFISPTTQKVFSNFFLDEPDPPQKFFILHSVFLI